MSDILDSLPAGVLQFLDDGRVLYANTSLRSLLGYEQTELDGLPFEKLLTIPSRIFYQTHFFPLLRMKGVVEEVYVSARHENGSPVPVLLNCARIDSENGTINECVLLEMRKRDEYEDQILQAKRVAEQATRDKIAAHEQLESLHLDLQSRNVELENLRRSLEDRVSERTRDLEELIAELQIFNYSIAHNFRTPLRAILAYSAILQSEAEDSLSADQMELMVRQTHNAKMLAALLEDLLKLSRIGLQTPLRSTIDLSAIARQAVANVIPDREVESRVHIQPDVEASADADLACILLECLFSNAHKYSPEGGILAFGQEMREGKSVYFVRDEGIGIDRSYHQQIFKPFERLHRDDEFSGNGIGLALVDRIIRHHRGQVWIESEEGKGTAVYFTFSPTREP